MATIFAEDFIATTPSETITATLSYSWKILLADPLYVFQPGLRQKTFTARILEKDIDALQISEWISPETTNPSNVNPFLVFEVNRLHHGIDMPFGITFLPSSILVCSFASFLNMMAEFDLDGNFLNYWPSASPIQYGSSDGQLNAPTGVVYDGEYVFIADKGNNRVEKFDLDGNFVTSITNESSISSPECIACDSNYLYIGDSGNGQILILDKLGAYQDSFTHADTNSFYPWEVAVNDSKIYVSDLGNGKVDVFDKEGNYLYRLGSGLATPRGVYADNSYAIVTNLYYPYSINVFDSSGTPIKSFMDVLAVTNKGSVSPNYTNSTMYVGTIF